ncbi:hypothetical protein [Tritonibacter scottomollicae]|uniref:Uncharacterized protein n=1 Tax=Tritonibacter scottomollicae TaxID=483013 RepID=A0A2T1AE95_TRISK|nr:hypothetical protein [Tritonibacter scottomollicae]PRZ46913.1 hypothetical protein CLV89_10859 [Tritonibacter scottomollicae]
MDADAVLVIGLVLAWLGVPAAVSAYAHRRSPVMAVALLLSGGGCVAWAALTHPDGYRLTDVPDVFFRVIGQLL